MPRVTQVLRRARKAIEGLDLLKILESELNHELSSFRYQILFNGAHDKRRPDLLDVNKDDKSSSFGDFALEWDSPQSQDVLLRKKCSSGEEVAVSALLGHDTFQGDGRLPREALLKICVKKSGLSSILQFDCVASNKGDTEAEIDIHSAHYMPSLSCIESSSLYKGPVYSDLNPTLQQELKQYLAVRGIEKNFTNALLLLLHKKEQGQYMTWLQKLKEMMALRE